MEDGYEILNIDNEVLFCKVKSILEFNEEILTYCKN